MFVDDVLCNLNKIYVCLSDDVYHHLSELIQKRCCFILYFFILTVKTFKTVWVFKIVI